MVSPSKDQAAERLTSFYGFVRSLAKRAKAPRVGTVRLAVLPEDTKVSQKGGVKSGVWVWWQRLAGRGTWPGPTALRIRHPLPSPLLLRNVGVDPDDHFLAVHHAVGFLVSIGGGDHERFAARRLLWLGIQGNPENEFIADDFCGKSNGSGPRTGWGRSNRPVYGTRLEFGSA